MHCIACALGCIISLTLALAGTARADYVVLSNGDRLSGEIVILEDGTLELNSPLVGTVMIPQDEVQTFSSDESLDIVFNDGTRILDSVESAENGAVRTVGHSRTGAGTYPIADIDSINEPPIRWHGELKAGAEFERGNSLTDEVDTSAKVYRESDLYRLQFYGYYRSERSGSYSPTRSFNTTEREVMLGTRYDHNVAPDLSWFGLSEAERDGIKDLDLRFRASTGLNKVWYADKTWGVNTDAGISWISEAYKDDSLDDNFVAGLFGWDWYWNVVARLRLFHRATWEPSFEDWDQQIVKTWTGARTDITSSLFFEVRHEYEWDTPPATGSRRSDHDYFANLGYKF